MNAAERERAIRSLDVGMSERTWREELADDGYNLEEIDAVIADLKYRIDPRSPCWSIAWRPTSPTDLKTTGANASLDESAACLVDGELAAVLDEYGTCCWKDRGRFPKADHAQWFEGMSSFAMELLAVAQAQQPARDDAGNALAPRKGSS